jgi:hypothetical protein
MRRGAGAAAAAAAAAAGALCFDGFDDACCVLGARAAGGGSGLRTPDSGFYPGGERASRARGGAKPNATHIKHGNKNQPTSHECSYM